MEPAKHVQTKPVNGQFHHTRGKCSIFQYRLYLSLRKKRTLDDHIKGVDDNAVDAEDVEDVEAEQPKTIGSRELALLLSTAGTKPSVLSVVPKYSDEYVPK